MAPTNVTPWTLHGAHDELIRGDAHPPRAGEPEAVAIVAHGFKGYKDYGFIPVLTTQLAARLPLVAHRFNFSHSGIGEDPATFQRPDLFERDTWSKQGFDLRCVMRAAASGELPHTPSDLPIILIGHSRGGVACLLSAGRAFRDGAWLTPSAVIAMSAPDSTLNLTEPEQETLRREGRLETVSGRTGQTLHLGREWLDEQLAAPADHDVLALSAHIRCPVLAIHGQDDPTVSADCARRIAEACSKGAHAILPGGDHVFNTPNPADLDTPMSEQLAGLVDAVEGFIRDHVLRE